MAFIELMGLLAVKRGYNSGPFLRIPLRRVGISFICILTFFFVNNMAGKWVFVLHCSGWSTSNNEEPFFAAHCSFPTSYSLIDFLEILFTWHK